MNQPTILSFLNKDQRISSKWIAANCNKKHSHVIRDIKEKFNNSKDPSQDPTFIIGKNGQVQEALITLAQTLVLMSGYDGEKAENSRQLVIQAVDYFIYRAPQVEAQNVMLQQAVESLTKDNEHIRARNAKLKAGNGKHAGTYMVPIYQSPKLFDDGFGDRVLVGYERKRLEDLNSLEGAQVELLHIRSVLSGVNKRESSSFGKLMDAQEKVVNKILLLQQSANQIL